MNKLMEDYLAYKNGEINDPNGAIGHELANDVVKACGYNSNPEGLKKWIISLKLCSLEKEVLEAEKKANQ